MRRTGFALFFLSAAGFAAVPAMAKEYPIGKAQEKAGMEIGAVYLQPIEMDPPDIMRPAKDSDVHLEADIHAAKGNTNGFAQGDWIPYLGVDYVVTKLDDNQTLKGMFMPMVADDGPHYGDNVKLFGPGKYKLVADHHRAGSGQAGRIRPPCRQGDRRRALVQAVHGRI